MRADRTVVLAAALVLAGLAAVAIAWAGVSATPTVSTQVAFVVSGGFGGFALVGAGVAVHEVQRRRYASAEERRDLARFASELGDVAELLAVHCVRPVRRRRVLRAR